MNWFLRVRFAGAEFFAEIFEELLGSILCLLDDCCKAFEKVNLFLVGVTGSELIPDICEVDDGVGWVVGRKAEGSWETEGCWDEGKNTDGCLGKINDEDWDKDELYDEILFELLLFTKLFVFILLTELIIVFNSSLIFIFSLFIFSMIEFCLIIISFRLEISLIKTEILSFKILLGFFWFFLFFWKNLRKVIWLNLIRHPE